MDNESIAKYLYEVGHLKRVKRSGWWLIGIRDPESVAEHVYRTAVLGYILAVLDGGADPLRVSCMCLFHDNGETRIGDVNKVTSRYLASKDGEAQAIAEQSARLPEQAAEQILALVGEYEERSSHEGELAHDADYVGLISTLVAYFITPNRNVTIAIGWPITFCKIDLEQDAPCLPHELPATMSALRYVRREPIMANQQHYDLLNQGVDIWNAWREKHREIPDLGDVSLGYANLSYADLSYAVFINADLLDADLSDANLRQASFNGARIIRANLRGANLLGADLMGARINDAILSDADLNGARINGADLRGANLRGANLLGADLSDANFRHAIFHQSIFAWVDLSNVQELETARHDGPSILEINSVILPRDEQTRLHFLRGVGFTETQIEYLPSLLKPRPIQYHSLFISYAHQDEALAKRLYDDLRKNDVLCWFAPEDMKIGDKLRHRIDESIYMHDKLLLLFSEHSVASQWVEHEVETALGKEREGQPNVLFPLRLDNAVMKSTTGWASHIRLTRHIGDFTNWQEDPAYQQAFSRLLRDLKVTQLPTP